MDDENYRDLVLIAWELSNAVDAMQKLLNKSVFDDFAELDRIALEKRLMNQTATMPF